MKVFYLHFCLSLTNNLVSLAADCYVSSLRLCNNCKSVKEDFVSAHVTEAPTVAPEPDALLETVDSLDTGLEAYDLKEYDLNEFDNKLYDYGTYDEYGPLPSKAPTAYEEEVGPGVAAETDFTESTVSTTPSPADGGLFAWAACKEDSLCLPVHEYLLAWYGQFVIDMLSVE